MHQFIRSRMRFSLRTWLCFILLTGFLAGWLGRQVQEYRVEQQIIAEIHASKPHLIPTSPGTNNGSLLAVR